MAVRPAPNRALTPHGATQQLTPPPCPVSCLVSQPPSAQAAVSPELQERLATAESRAEELAAELARTKDELRLAKARSKRVLSVLTQSESEHGGRGEGRSGWGGAGGSEEEDKHSLFMLSVLCVPQEGHTRGISFRGAFILPTVHNVQGMMCPVLEVSSALQLERLWFNLSHGYWPM